MQPPELCEPRPAPFVNLCAKEVSTIGALGLSAVKIGEQKARFAGERVDQRILARPRHARHLILGSRRRSSSFSHVCATHLHYSSNDRALIIVKMSEGDEEWVFKPERYRVRFKSQVSRVVETLSLPLQSEDIRVLVAEIRQAMDDLSKV